MNSQYVILSQFIKSILKQAFENNMLSLNIKMLSHSKLKNFLLASSKLRSLRVAKRCNMRMSVQEYTSGKPNVV